ncbi:MAG TPA: hypothetical protein VFU32_00285, partial [Ktedonobacterales bacterium]|nr:hypothetical protein [Ktedonobacterales bacterium]
MAESITGLVIGSVHGIFDVAVGQEVIRCTLRGKLRKQIHQPAPSLAGSAHRRGFSRFFSFNKASAPQRSSTSKATAVIDPPEEEEAPPIRISVGDFVRLTRIDAKTGVIEEALPRRNKMSRGSS